MRIFEAKYQIHLCPEKSYALCAFAVKRFYWRLATGDWWLVAGGWWLVAICSGSLWIADWCPLGA